MLQNDVAIMFRKNYHLQLGVTLLMSLVFNDSNIFADSIVHRIRFANNSLTHVLILERIQNELYFKFSYTCSFRGLQ